MLELVLTAKDEDAWLLAELLRSADRPRIVFARAIIDRKTTITGEIKMLIITDSQEVDLAIKPLTRKGHPAQVDGVPAWSTSDPAIATVTPAADGLSCVIKAADNIGPVQISVTADADLGEGVQNLTGVLDLEVIGGAAATLSVIAGTPREQA